MERRHAPDAVDATGRLIADCYCPRCDHYSGGGICRMCRREIAIEEGNATPTAVAGPARSSAPAGERST